MTVGSQVARAAKELVPAVLLGVDRLVGSTPTSVLATTVLAG